mgnify:FL=1
MIVTFEEFRGFPDADICVVGSGPIGLALAHACVKRGLKVLMLESGHYWPDEQKNDLGKAGYLDTAHHVPLEEGCCRALGGNSYQWGGRCVPFDPIDFEARPWIGNSGWPISAETVTDWYPEAAAFLRCRDDFTDTPLWPDNGRVRSDTLESWVANPNIAHVYGDWLKACDDICVVLDATVVDLRFNANDTRVEAVTVANGSARTDLSVKTLVVAAGGVQTPRLLLAAQRTRPDLFGGVDGPLGRYYMGHVSGKIAEITLADPASDGFLDYEMDGNRFKRRRITLTESEQRTHGLPQITFSAGNPVVYDPAHRNGALSAIWMVLSSPLGNRFLNAPLRRLYLGEEKQSVLSHALNILRSPIATGFGAFNVFRQMYLQKPKRPSVFLKNRKGRYTLYYHGEQTPSADNRVRLSPDVDALGMPRVAVDFDYSAADADGVLKAHAILAEAVAEAGIGTIDYSVPEDARAAAIVSQARDGLHQIGTTRMSTNPKPGVVDTDCRVHGLQNLYVASTSVMPTSGHANPTFVGVALAMRLAAHLGGPIKPERTTESEATDAATARATGRRILVTGASGKIGQHVVRQLLDKGHAVVALTSNPDRAAGREPDRDVTWCHHDWRESVDFTDPVRGCDAVIHLGAEIWRIERMERVNVEATAALAAAAEAAGIRSFVFASSIAVYGSPMRAEVDEESTRLTSTHDVKSEYRGTDSIRAYGRSKVKAEDAIAAACRNTHFAVVRPTVVADVDDIANAVNMNPLVKSIGAKRLTHFVYIADVAAAMIWLMERGLSQPADMPGRVETFNLSDEAGYDTSYRGLYSRLEALSGRGGLGAKLASPLWVYDLFDRLKSKSLSRGLPLGRCVFPATRLHDAGYSHPFGMAMAERLAADRIRER